MLAMQLHLQLQLQHYHTSSVGHRSVSVTVAAWINK